tara:strand:+ start:198 stop:494 length:297 start_codon:yes stop_codon:yes gene_type:complete
MNLKNINSVLKKFDVDVDSIKDDLEAAVQEEVNEVKKEMTSNIKDKILYYLDDEKGKKEMIKKINDAIDIPWISESVEEKIFTVVFNVISGAIKKVLV